MTTEEQHEDRFHRTVVEALEALEGPDRARLARIEQRLLAAARRSRFRPWKWMVIGLGLAAGAATAYWGAGPGPEVDVDSRAEVTPDAGRADGPRKDPGARADDGGQHAPGAGSVPHEDDNPVIYIGE